MATRMGTRAEGSVVIPRRVRRDRVWRSWTIAWVGGPVLGVANGAARQAFFGGMSDDAAHQLSTATLIALLALYIWWVERRTPLPSTKTALQIGATWTALTIAFEFAFGLLTGDSFANLLHAYNVADGQIWILIPAWIFVAPALFRRLSTHSR